MQRSEVKEEKREKDRRYRHMEYGRRLRDSIRKKSVARGFDPRITCRQFFGSHPSAVNWACGWPTIKSFLPPMLFSSRRRRPPLKDVAAALKGYAGIIVSAMTNPTDESIVSDLPVVFQLFVNRMLCRPLTQRLPYFEVRGDSCSLWPPS